MNQDLFNIMMSTQNDLTELTSIKIALESANSNKVLVNILIENGVISEDLYNQNLQHIQTLDTQTNTNLKRIESSISTLEEQLKLIRSIAKNE